ncbi:Adenosylhomocysteinase [Capsicum chinense]|nr:Adenosylhomocysteinase [Capsicum chinense]
MDGCFLEIEFLSLCVRLPPRHLCQRLRLYGMVFIVDDPIRLNAFFFALNQQTFSKLLNAVAEELKPIVQQKLEQLNRKSTYHVHHQNNLLGFSGEYSLANKQSFKAWGTNKIAAPVREFGSQVPTTTQFLLVKPVDEHIRRFEIDMHGLETFPGVKRISIKPQTYSGIIVLAEGHLMNLGCATGHPSFGGDAASRPVSPMDARKSHDDNDPNDIL